MPKKKTEPKTFQNEIAGYLYQVKVLLLFFWRAMENRCAFQLGTEITNAEKFDDAVFSFIKNGRIRVRCLQAKHSNESTKVLEYEHFVTDRRAEICNLKKYFISFRKMKQKFGSQLNDLIICSNIPFKMLTLKKHPQDSNDQAIKFREISDAEESDIFFDSTKIGQWKRYKLTQANGELKKKFLTGSSLMLLAEEMVKFIFKDENKNSDENDHAASERFWIEIYQEALKKDNVINEQFIIKFKTKYLKENDKFAQKCKEVTTLTPLQFQSFNLNNDKNAKVMSYFSSYNEHPPIASTIEGILVDHALKNVAIDSYLLENALLCEAPFDGSFESMVKVFRENCDKILLRDCDIQKWTITDTLKDMIENVDQNVDAKAIEEDNLVKTLVIHLINQEPLDANKILKANKAFLKKHLEITEHAEVNTANCSFLKKSSTADINKKFKELYSYEKLKMVLNILPYENEDELDISDSLNVAAVLKQQRYDVESVKLLKLLYSNSDCLKSAICRLKRNGFTMNFLNGINLNKNAKAFREIFFEQCMHQAAENSANIKLYFTSTFEELFKKERDIERIPGLLRQTKGIAMSCFYKKMLDEDITYLIPNN